MTETLQVVETIQRTGYTVIDGVRVVQHICSISSEDPTNMRVSMVKMNNEMYKTNRSTCRDDFAVFEDAAYALQEELITKAEAEKAVEETEA